MNRVVKFSISCISSFITNKICIKKKPIKQCTEWEKIFTNDISNEGLISKIYKQRIQFNTKTTTAAATATNNPIKSRQKTGTIIFLKKTYR